MMNINVHCTSGVNVTDLPFTSRDLRDVMGLLPSGVVVVTATVADSRIGATVSSFNSLSLDPPLVLFSIARSSWALAAWEQAKEFAVSVLAEDQSSLSTRFARALTDKWNGVTPMEGAVTGAPLLPGALAWMECERYAQYSGGDHEIFVGRVLALRVRAQNDPRPLVFFKSKYRRLDPEQRIETPLGADLWLHGW